MKIVFLDESTLGNADLSCFKDFGEYVSYPFTKKEDTIERIKDANIVITNKVLINQEVMDKCKNIKLICVAATGMNNIDLAYAKQKGIEVKNVAGYSTQSVAQHTLMQALSFLGKNHFYDNWVKSGQWVKSEIFVNLDEPFFDIENKKWGIIGLGSIGLKVARLAKAFDCDICYYSTSGKNNSTEFKQVALNELLQTCDIISVHCPLNDTTNNLIDAKKLSLLKQDAILINVARGGIINENDLVDCINEKKIYAAVDVLSREPMCSDSSYLNIKHKERILFTPHTAWASFEARKRLVQGIYKNIKTFLKENNG